MAYGDAVIIEPQKTGAAPLTYQLAAGQTLEPLLLRADFDGSGAAGDFIPQVSFYAQDGRKLGSFPAPAKITAGDSQGVTFFPLALPGDGSGASGSLTVTDGTHTVSPASEIDFTSGATVTDLGGGVAGVAVGAVTTYEICSGTVAFPNAAVQFAHVEGSTFLDYSNPGRPKFTLSGTFAIWGTATGLAIPAANQWVQLALGVNTGHTGVTGGFWTNINYGGGQLYQGGFSATAALVSGNSFEVDCSASDNTYDASVFLYVQRLA